jgi:hypothetical protein
VGDVGEARGDETRGRLVLTASDMAELGGLIDWSRKVGEEQQVRYESAGRAGRRNLGISERAGYVVEENQGKWEEKVFVGQTSASF